MLVLLTREMAFPGPDPHKCDGSHRQDRYMAAGVCMSGNLQFGCLTLRSARALRKQGNLISQSFQSSEVGVYDASYPHKSLATLYAAVMTVDGIRNVQTINTKSAHQPQSYRSISDSQATSKPPAHPGTCPLPSFRTQSRT